MQLDLLMKPAPHPAKYSPTVLVAIREALAETVGTGSLVLDPFAGTGRIHRLRLEFETVGVEKEPEWACQSEGTEVGDALNLQYENRTFDAIATSPCYGNRMADHHNAKDASDRNTYTHKLGRKLSPGNAGAMQWGDEYRAFHVQALREFRRVLKDGGVFVLNMSDHIRKLAVMPVTDWWIDAATAEGYVEMSHRKVETPRQRHGENGNLRVAFESVITFRAAA